MFKERIRENYDGLTPGFRKLADFIMDSTLDVAFLTATELSKRGGRPCNSGPFRAGTRLFRLSRAIP